MFPFILIVDDYRQYELIATFLTRLVEDKIVYREVPMENCVYAAAFYPEGDKPYLDSLESLRNIRKIRLEVIKNI